MINKRVATSRQDVLKKTTIVIEQISFMCKIILKVTLKYIKYCGKALPISSQLNISA